MNPSAGYSGLLTLKVTATAGANSNMQILKVNVGNQVISAQGFSFTGATEGLLNTLPVANFTATRPLRPLQVRGHHPLERRDHDDGHDPAGIRRRLLRQHAERVRPRRHLHGLGDDHGHPERPQRLGLPVSIRSSTPPYPPTFASPTPAPGTASISGTIAIFADSNAKSNPADLSASIDWGDGSTTPGTIVRAADGSYAVTGSKTYAAIGELPRPRHHPRRRRGDDPVRRHGDDPQPRPDPRPDRRRSRSARARPFTSRRRRTSPTRASTSSTRSPPDRRPGRRSTPSRASSPTRPPRAPPSVPITVVATDSGTPAMTASTTFTVTVLDVPPTLVLPSGPGFRQFGTFTAAGRFTDPGLGPWTATVNYGDGSGPQPLALAADRSFALSHAYASPGTFLAERESDRRGRPDRIGHRRTSPFCPSPPVTWWGRRPGSNKKKQILGVDLALYGIIDPAGASNARNFVILAPGRDRKFGTRDDVTTRFSSASYNPSTGTLSLSLTKPLAAKGPLQLRMSNLRDVFGRPIAGGFGRLDRALDREEYPDGPVGWVQPHRGGTHRDLATATRWWVSAPRRG